MLPITLPKIYCPFPSSINPYVEEAHEHTIAWAKHFCLVQKDAAMRRFLASRFSWLTARAYPSVGKEELKLLNDWLTWLFLFDDQFDEGLIIGQPSYIQTLLDGYSAIFTNPDAIVLQSPAAQALTDLVQRTFSQMPSVWQMRFAKHFKAYFDTYIWSVNNCTLATVPNLSDYIEKRRDSGSVYPAIDLIDLAEHVALPLSLMESPEFQRLMRITNDVVCWSNDIISLEKEIARGDVNNLVLVVQHAENLPLQEAVDKVGTMVSSAVRLFEQTERALQNTLQNRIPELERDMQKYLNVLKAWMRGNLDWAVSTGRYAQVEQTASGGAVSYLESIVTTAEGGIATTEM